MISVRIKTAIWWGKHKTLMSLSKQVMASQRAVQVIQKTL